IPGDGRGECNERGAKRTEEIRTPCPEISQVLQRRRRKEYHSEAMMLLTGKGGPSIEDECLNRHGNRHISATVVASAMYNPPSESLR
ncbi:hypothetical protein M404DRAFT_1003774, partial [Pisolithus tinctorius Marx 270]